MELWEQDMACKEPHDPLSALKSICVERATPSACPVDQPEGNSLLNMEPIALGITLLPSVELYPPSAYTVSGPECDEKGNQNVAFEVCEQDAAEQVTGEAGNEIPPTAPTPIISTQPTSNSDQNEVEFILSITRKRRKKRKYSQDQTKNHLHSFIPLAQADLKAGHQNLEALEFKTSHDKIAPEHNPTSQIMGRFNLPMSPTCPQTDATPRTFPIIRESDPSSTAAYTISRDQTLARICEPPGFQHDCMAVTTVPKIVVNAQRKRRHNQEHEDDHLIDPELRKLDRQTRETQLRASQSSQPTAIASSRPTASSMYQLQASTGLASLNPVSIPCRLESSFDHRASSLTPSNDQLRRPSLYSIPAWPSIGQSAETSTTDSIQTPYHSYNGRQQVDFGLHCTPNGHWFRCTSRSAGSPSALTLQPNAPGYNANESRGPFTKTKSRAGNEQYETSSTYVGHRANHQPHESPAIFHGNTACEMSNPSSTSNVKTSLIAHGGNTNPYISHIKSAGTLSYGEDSSGTVPYNYIPQQQVLQRDIPTYSRFYPHSNGMPSREPKLQHLLVDIAQTAQQVFPFQNVARKHNIPMQKVFDAFSAIIQLPLLRSAADSQRQGSLGLEKLKDFSKSEKEIQGKHKGARKVASKTNQVTPAKRGRPPKKVKLTENQATALPITPTLVKTPCGAPLGNVLR